MTEIRRQMETLSQSGDDIASPLSFAWISESGFKRL
jgi:hypothetical protein